MKDALVKWSLLALLFVICNLYLAHKITDDMAIKGLTDLKYTNITLVERHEWFVPFFRGGSKSDMVVYTAIVGRSDGKIDTVRVYISTFMHTVSVRKP